MEHDIQKPKHDDRGRPAGRSSPRGESAPASHPLQEMQAQTGNAAVQWLLRSGGVQAKIRIGSPDDPEEREADDVAEQVMHPPAVFGGPAHCACDGSDEKCEACRHATVSVQRRTTGAASTRAGTEPAIVERVLRSAGRPLDAVTRAFFERRFGREFGHIRVHTEPEAQQSARAIQARAYAAGSHLVFDRGEFAPDTPEGRQLLAHELTHTIQQGESGPIRRQPPPGKTYPPPGTDLDSDQPYPPEPKNAPDDSALPMVGNRDFDFAISDADPTILLVPGESSVQDIAFRLLGDDNRADQFDFVPVPDDKSDKRGVRLRRYNFLKPEPYKLIRDALDKQLDTDTVWVKDKLKERFIDSRDITQVVLRWSQRSIITDASGTQYFEKFLAALDKWELTSFWGTRKTAYEWLLDEIKKYRELLEKAITLRSTRDVGYKPSDQQPEFKRGDTVGRFFYSKGDYDPFPIKVQERIAAEDTLEKAEIITRSTAAASWDVGTMRIIVPGSDGKFYGYTVYFKWREPRGKYDYDSRPSPSSDPKGEYLWYYPGTIFINPKEFRMDYAQGSPEAANLRRSLMTGALFQATVIGSIDPIASLDFEVLATATFEERFTMINMVLNGTRNPTESGAELIARIFITTPNSEFPAMERRMSTDGTLSKLNQLALGNPWLAVVGRAFTYRSVQALPPSADELSNMETLEYGIDSDDYLHYAGHEFHKVTSQTVGPESWNPTAKPSIGNEPTRPGETPGSFNREVIRFYRARLKTGGFFKLLFSGDPAPPGSYTRDFLPTELVRIQIIGEHPQVQIVTALEAAGMLDLTSADVWRHVAAPIINAWMWGTAITRLGFGITGGIVGTTAVQAVKTFAWEAVVLGSMQIVDAYREELAQTEAGRTFLAIYDIAMTALMARDLYKVLSSGVLLKLVQASGQALSAVKQATRLALDRTLAEIEALNLAWQRLEREEGALIAVEGGGAALRVPKSPERFQQLWMAARAETYGARALGRLKQAGEATGEAESLFKKLQAISEESPEMAKAHRQLAERIGTLRGLQLQNVVQAFQNTLNNSRKLTSELGGWLQAAVKAADPTRYLAEVDKLIAKTGVSKEAIEVMGNKAAAGTLDIAWLNSTSLTQRDISTLGADPRTPWSAYQKAAASTDEASQFWARTSVRGASAEIVLERNARTMLPDHVIRGAQVPMGDSIIDFEVTAKGLGSRHGLEIKGWTKDTWKDALDLVKKRMTPGEVLTKAEEKTVAKIDHMIKQLKDARSATGNPPLLGITSDLDEAQTKILQRLLRSEGLGDTAIIRISEVKILEMGRALRSAMGIP